MPDRLDARARNARGLPFLRRLVLPVAPASPMLSARSAGASVLAASGLLAALLTLSACQDPSGVGLGLIGEEGGDPNLVFVLPDSLFLSEEPEVTGGLADGSLPVQERALVGALVDAVFGDARAEAYVDFRPPTTIPTGFRDRTITSATLRLVRDVVYGDSTVTLDVAVDEMAASFDPVGAPADTTFEVGDLLATYDVAATDTVFSLALPDAWVEENDEALRSDTVAAAFDGFRVRLEEGAFGGAVVGFDATASSLRLTTSEDTVDYPLREVLTHLERGPAMPPPPDRLYLRDGADEVLAFTFPLGALDDVAVAQATLRLDVDPALLDMGTAAPGLPERLTLFGITEDGDRASITTAELDEGGAAYYFTSSGLTNVVQDAVLGATTFTRFEVEPLRSPASLAVAPVLTGPPPAAGEPERRPRLVLTVIPVGN